MLINLGPRVSKILKSLPAFEMFPNPARDFVTIKNATPISQITILNSIGIQVFKGAFGSERATVDISHLASGTYHVSVISEGGQLKVQRLVIAR